MEFFKELSSEVIVIIILIIAVLILWVWRSLKLWLQMEKVLFRKKKYELIEKYSKTPSTEKMLFYSDNHVKEHNKNVKRFLQLYDGNLERISKKKLLQVVVSYKYDKEIPLFVDEIIIHLQKQKEMESTELLELLGSIIPFEKQRLENLLKTT